MSSKIKPVKKIRYKDQGDNQGKNTSGVIYIPEKILKKQKRKGLTLHLNFFYICKDLLNYRNHTDHKIGIFSNPSGVRIGDKDYTKDYVKTEIILPEREMSKISKMVQKGGETDEE